MQQIIGSRLKSKNRENKWSILFFVIVAFWALVLVSTVSGRLYGVYGLVDRSVDLSFITIPLLAIIMLYTVITFFIFITHLLAIKKARNYQLKLCSPSVNKEPPVSAIGIMRNLVTFDERSL